MKNIVCFLLYISLFFCSCNGSKKLTNSKPSANQVGVHFVQANLLSEVLDQAAAENKMVFVDFYTTWCLPCKLMDEDVFSDREIGNFMNDHFISYKVDAERGNGPNLQQLFGVYAYPTLLFMDSNGKVVERKEGAAYHTELKAMASRALANEEI